jgi:hypothetical protein
VSGKFQAPATLLPGKAPLPPMGSRYGHFREGKNLLLPGIETRSLSCLARSLVDIPTQLSRFRNTLTHGRAMAQEVSRRPPTAEAWVRSRVSLCGICGGQSGTGTGLPRVIRFSPVNFVPPVLPLLGKMKKLIIFLFIFITGLHNKS